MTTILVVEDDAGIRAGLTRTLTERGYGTIASATGLEGLTRAVDEQPDAVLLDLGLPDVDGLDLLRMLRAVSSVPVLVVTARDEDEEVVRTLDAGADDYIVKPFSASQLEARVRAVLRRAAAPADEPAIRIGGLLVDPAAREVSVDGRSVELSRKEFDLLHFLATRAGRVTSKRQMLAEVWNQPYGGTDKTVDVHLSWLRRKLGESASEPRYLRTVHGVGVRLVDPGDGEDEKGPE